MWVSVSVEVKSRADNVNIDNEIPPPPPPSFSYLLFDATRAFDMEEVARRRRKKMRFSGEKGGTFSFFDSIHSALERQEGRTRRTE